MKKLNNKGYMLVEIILTFAIAFTVVYFIMDLVIKLKNKNDDLMVETLVKTDQTIITNKLMDYAIDENEEFNCDDLSATDHSVTYKGDLIVVINKYSKIDKSRVTCENNLGKVSIKIPLSVKQMKENYDIDVDYKYRIGDMVAPTCSLSVSGTAITATYSDNDGGSGLDSSNFCIKRNQTGGCPEATLKSSGFQKGENKETKTIEKKGFYTFIYTDKANNVTTCQLEVVNSLKYCASGSDTGSGCKSSSAASYHQGGGSCSCVHNGPMGPDYHGGCNCANGSAVCSNSSYTVESSSCYGGWYDCPGGEERSGSSCISYHNYSYRCPVDDYNKIDNSYCYKVIE